MLKQLRLARDFINSQGGIIAVGKTGLETLEEQGKLGQPNMPKLFEDEANELLMRLTEGGCITSDPHIYDHDAYLVIRQYLEERFGSPKDYHEDCD